MADFNVSSDDEFHRARFGRVEDPSKQNDRPEQAVSDSDSNESLSGAEDGLYGVPSAFGGTRARRPRKRPRTAPPISEKKERQTPPQEEPGGWEKHTKGIGAKLLEKMGFTGRLGVRGDGITEPIQTAARENQGAGLGKGRRQEKSDEQVIKEERRAREKDTAVSASSKPVIPRWKKKDRHTVSDNAQGKVSKVPPPKERVIDMRSGEAREVGSVAEALEKTHLPRQRTNAELFAAPELCHNVQLLLDSARVDTESAVRARETEKLIGDNARREHKRLLVDLETQQRSRKSISKLEHEIRCLAGAESDEDFALVLEQGCSAIFEECKMQQPRFLLREVLMELAQPRIRSCFRAAAQDAEGDTAKKGAIAARILHALRTPLSGGSEAHFLRLCARTVLRETRALTLDVLNGDSLAAAMTSVRHALHPAVLSTFAEDILVPALEAALRRASSRGTPPPHVWIHVWLPAVGADALETLFPALRSRIARGLGPWDPAAGADATKRAQHELRAWTGVIPRRKLHATVSRVVLPKIAAHLRGSDPGAQVMWIAETVSLWADLAPTRALADVLAPSLWNQVHDVRDALFVHPRTSGYAAECARQYLAWKDAFGGLQKYVRHVLGAFLFVLAADARSAQNPSLRGRLATEDVRQLGANAYRREREQKSASVEPRRMGVGERASIGDAVAALAQSKGLALLPDGRDRDGRAMFSFGKVRIVLDGTRQLVLRVNVANGRQVLEPISLTQLVNVALTGS